MAITLCVEPEILLVDENVGAGDAAFKKKLGAAVGGFFEKANIIILASHDMNFLRLHCNKLVTFSHGRIDDVSVVQRG